MHRTSRAVALCTVLLAATISCAPACASLVLNGDFENDLVGWTFVPDVRIGTGEAYRDRAGATGDTGTGRFASFGSGDATALGSLSQAIATVAGESYALTFSYGAFSTLQRVQSLRVTIGATSFDITTPVASGNLANVLQPYSFLFAASDSSTTITFSDRSADTISVDGLLDDVRVAAVPTPGAIALIGAGLLGLFAAGRRRVARA